MSEVEGGRWRGKAGRRGEDGVELFLQHRTWEGVKGEGVSLQLSQPFAGSQGGGVKVGASACVASRG